ncbi:hypothetical protein HU200_059943 [Digitaria exilis]|uniref:Uncharacterized protein n=1 Tax=Digitaria exilis TaxID=1010633 RepID=A0A835DZH8_9POAL|nr:hypothetical protein HU200_059943 [Digitaria exilis]
MPHYLPDENSKVTKEDCLPMCKGLRFLLNSYGFYVKPEMVNDCWLPYGHQLKLITALMIVGYPNVEQIVFGDDYSTLVKDAPKYKDKLYEVACFRVYKEMLWARRLRYRAVGCLNSLSERPAKTMRLNKR